MNKILFVPNAKLRQQSETIKKITKKDIDLSKKMIDIMLKVLGVGLAANQIGVLKKIVTIHIHTAEDETDRIYALFNPLIKSYSQKKIIMEE
jgi:peptide deformylase